MIAPRPSSRFPDCCARSHRSRSRVRARASRRVSARASSSPSSRASSSSSSSSPVRRSNSRHSPRTLAFSPVSLSMRTAASGFFQKSGAACSRLSSASSCSICSGLKPRGCPGCQLPGLCGGRFPAVSLLGVPIHFFSSFLFFSSCGFQRLPGGFHAGLSSGDFLPETFRPVSFRGPYRGRLRPVPSGSGRLRPPARFPLPPCPGPCGR